MTPFIWQFLGVAAAMAACDWCWTRYMLATAAKHAGAAAWWSAAIVGISAFSVVSYVSDHRLLAAALIGAWIGTYAAVKAPQADSGSTPPPTP